MQRYVAPTLSRPKNWATQVSLVAHPPLNKQKKLKIIIQQVDYKTSSEILETRLKIFASFFLCLLTQLLNPPLTHKNLSASLLFPLSSHPFHKPQNIITYCSSTPNSLIQETQTVYSQKMVIKLIANRYNFAGNHCSLKKKEKKSRNKKKILIIPHALQGEAVFKF